MEIIATNYPVSLSVINCPTKKGYSIKHNQQQGWKGIKSYWFAWYKYKSDAIEAAESLQKCYNKPS